MRTYAQYKYLGIITAVYITFQLVSDVTAGKIIQIGNYPMTATVLYFPFTYIIADVLTEVYGYAVSRRVVWMVLFCSIIAGLLYSLLVILPPAKGFVNNEAYSIVLGQVPRILIGGWIAVWTGSITNDYMLAKLKVLTNGRFLWIRTISSTFIGEGVNTVLFFVIALYSVIPNNLLIASILSGWVIKVIIEVVMTPLTYFIVKTLKAREGVDHFDTKTNFNPLIIR